jgi:hypothetical protein
VKFGRTVAEVMRHHGKAPDVDLSAEIGFVLLDKEERAGIGAFTRGERFVAAVQGMNREVHNGGWDQFFRNSCGALAFDLVPALDAMGSRETLSIAQRALRLFGKPRSLSGDDRSRQLAAITRNGEDSPWHALEDEFYEYPEDLDAMLLRYIAGHPDEFPD